MLPTKQCDLCYLPNSVTFLSAVRDSSRVKGMSNQRARVMDTWNVIQTSVKQTKNIQELQEFAILTQLYKWTSTEDRR